MSPAERQLHKQSEYLFIGTSAGNRKLIVKPWASHIEHNTCARNTVAHLGSRGKVKDRDRPRVARSFIRLGTQETSRDSGVGERGV